MKVKIKNDRGVIGPEKEFTVVHVDGQLLWVKDDLNISRVVNAELVCAVLVGKIWFNVSGFNL